VFVAKLPNSATNQLHKPLLRVEGSTAADSISPTGSEPPIILAPAARNSGMKIFAIGGLAAGRLQ
jgi:hypothetical protein